MQQPPGGYGPPGGGYGAPPPTPYGGPPGYGAPPGPAYGAPPMQASPYGYGPPPGMMTMQQAQVKNPGIAVLLELLPGFLCQTFGIGTIYAGNVGLGVGFMIGYWVLTAINFCLCFVLVGFVTWPLTWIAAMVITGIVASNTAKATNAKLAAGQMI